MEVPLHFQSFYKEQITMKKSIDFDKSLNDEEI